MILCSTSFFLTYTMIKMSRAATNMISFQRSILRFTKLSLLLFFFLLLCFPQITIKGGKEGLLLWYSTIVPVLLPFVILSNTLISIQGIHYFSYLFYPLYKIFPTLLPCLSSLFTIGLFCGYPMGAKMIDDFIATGQMTKRQGYFFLCICNHASPMFLIGYVKTAILKNTISLPLLLLSIYSPVLIFLLLGILINPSLFFTCKPITSSPKAPFQNEMDIMTNSFSVILKVGGYIILFSILSQFLSQLPFQHTLLKSFLIGISEVTTGIRYIGALTIPAKEKTAFIGALSTFGGISSIAQTKSVFVHSKLSIFPYIVAKTIFALFTALFLYLLT